MGIDIATARPAELIAAVTEMKATLETHAASLRRAQEGVKVAHEGIWNETTEEHQTAVARAQADAAHARRLARDELEVLHARDLPALARRLDERVAVGLDAKGWEVFGEALPSFTASLANASAQEATALLRSVAATGTPGQQVAAARAAQDRVRILQQGATLPDGRIAQRDIAAEDAATRLASDVLGRHRDASLDPVRRAVAGLTGAVGDVSGWLIRQEGQEQLAEAVAAGMKVRWPPERR